MIIAIRIAGQVEIKKDIKATLERLRLKKKYASVLLKEEKEVLGMLKKVSNYVAFGRISKEVLNELIMKRARLPGNKPIEAKKFSPAMLEEIHSGKKKLADFGLKPFFRLHPPRGGFKKTTKELYPVGVLGNWNGDINKLIKKML
jgi:large subunit ribosomal protein L30